MARNRKLYSWRNLVIGVAVLAAIVLMTLSVEHIAPEWIFYAFCIALLYGLIYVFARQLHPKIKPPQWGWVVATAYVIPQVVVHPLSMALMADEEYTPEQRFSLSFMACCVTVLMILIILSLIFRNKKKKPKMRKKIVAGNWKMNTLPAEGVELAKNVAADRASVCECVNFIVCPPFTHLSQVVETLKGTDIKVGAQNCAAEEKGAYTGEVAASMIAALGCEYVILGHSERRQYYGETSETLNKKMAQAYANNLVPIYCVGENLEEREAGNHFDVCKAQIEEVVFNLTEEQFGKLVIAYEPVWAIGTGKTATADQAQEIHAYIREVLRSKFGAAAEECPILYGGSCKPSNAAEIFAKADVDGGLIGGAALKAEDFLGIGKGF